MALTTMFTSLARATSQLFSPKLWWLVWLPFGVSFAAWFFAAQFLHDPLSAIIRDAVSGFEFPQLIKAFIPMGLFDGLRTVWIPLLVMLITLPILVISGLLLMGLFAMPFIVNHVAKRNFPTLEKRGRAVFFRSLANAIWSSIVFALLWLVAAFTWLIPLLGFVVHALLWAWLVARVFRFDALCEYATAEELKALSANHTISWLSLGFLGSTAHSFAAGVWVGGAIFPFFLIFSAIFALWFSLVAYLWTGLAFSYFGLGRLARLREEQSKAQTKAENSAPTPPRDENEAFANAKDITAEVNANNAPPALPKHA